MSAQDTIQRLQDSFEGWEQSISQIVKFRDVEDAEKLTVNETLISFRNKLNKAFESEETRFLELSLGCSLIVALFDDWDLVDELIESNSIIIEEIQNMDDYLVFAQQQLNKCFEIFTGTFSRNPEHYVIPLSIIVFGLFQVHSLNQK